MKKNDNVAYCGLHCELCARRGRVPQLAQQLKDTMKDEGYEYTLSNVPNFKEFWNLLEHITDKDNNCPGCKQNGGYPGCEIRECFNKQEKEIEMNICPNCNDFPCNHIENLNKTYPILINDGLKLKSMGAENWIIEKEDRKELGFVYADIRIKNK